MPWTHEAVSSTLTIQTMDDIQEKSNEAFSTIYNLVLEDDVEGLLQELRAYASQEQVDPKLLLTVISATRYATKDTAVTQQREKIRAKCIAKFVNQGLSLSEAGQIVEDFY